MGDYKDFKQPVKDVQDKIAFTESQASEIRSLAHRYPFEKFITTIELDRICDKYGLLHAPVANYIKDVPEKNVLEMKNRKPLDVEDAAEVIYELHGFKNDRFINLIGKTDYKFTESEVIALGESHGKHHMNHWVDNLKAGHAQFSFSILSELLGGFTNNFTHDDYNYDSMTVTDQTGLQVAAPKSHFSLEGLKKITKFGFGNVREVEVKDPVVFEHCKNGIVRIITKWGTDDDQSYLDESLINPALN